MVENYEDLIANSNLAFSGGEYESALNFAKKAIGLESKDIDGFLCAGKASLSLDKVDDAVDYFKKAAEINDKSGNVFFLLGYAQAMAHNESGSLKSLTRAVERDCEEPIRGQIYKIMAMLNMDRGEYEDALINIRQAEQIVGLDEELLRNKAACYTNLKNYRKALFTLNQMKLLKPKDYSAYSLSFHIFMDLGIYDEAKKELERARDYSQVNMTYYSDRVAYALLHDLQDDNDDTVSERWYNTLREINNALLKGKPNAEQAFEMYLRASQLYISLDMPGKAIACLDFAEDPVLSFNQGVSVLLDEKTSTASNSSQELSLEEEEAEMQEKWDNGEFEDLSEQIQLALDDLDDDDPDQVTEEIQKYLSPIDCVPEDKKENEKYIIEETFTAQQTHKDMKNALYVAAYEMERDYDKMLEKARELQASSITANQYSGIYFELRVGKYRNDSGWEKKYKDRINFWKKRMVEDPTDYVSASYRIRSLVDIGEFEDAEQLCSCLPVDLKEPLMEEIQKEKSEGGYWNGNTSE